MRVVTPGTTFSDQILEGKYNNFTLSIIEKNNTFGIAFADLTTGDFFTAEVDGLQNLKKEIFRIAPKEAILPRQLFSLEELKLVLENIYFFDIPAKAEQNLCNFFHLKSLHSFGIEKMPLAIIASYQLIQYFQETQKTDLVHITKIRKFNAEDFLPLDESTIRNLELFYTLREGKKEGALLNLIDETKTAMGGRKLKRWILQPLLNQQKIEGRLQAVAELLEDYEMRQKIILQLKEILDLERILARLSCGRSNARDLIALRESLKKARQIKKIIEKSQSCLLQEVQKKIG